MPNSTADALTPSQRRLEIAAILGRGLVRLRTACFVEPTSCDSAPEFPDQ
jgi:hypothetical protein